MLERREGYSPLNIVDNAEESEMELVALKVHVSNRSVAEDPLEIGKGSFHGIAHTTFLAVGFF